jgi:cysteine desulfurase
VLSDLTYLDHAASTPMRPEAVEAMGPFLADHFGNPSGSHHVARVARRAIDDARDSVAALVGCRPGDVVFTSGGTEADATAIAGVARARPGPVVVGAIEHHAVLDAATALGASGTEVIVLSPDRDGHVDLDIARDALDGRDRPPALVSVSLANNEVGTTQRLDDLADLLDAHAPKAVLHTDAVQAAAWLDLPALAARAQLVSLSAHKLGGPKGVGALVVREGTPLVPLLRGGGQEGGRRSGTPNVPGIVGFGTAAGIVAAERDAASARVAVLRGRLADGLLAKLRPFVPDVIETVVQDGNRDHLLPGHVHLCLPGVAAEEVLFLLDQEGVAASAAASCASGATEPSHVLAALGVTPDVARGALRLTLGWSSTDADVERALEVVPAAVARITSTLSPQEAAS